MAELVKKLKIKTSAGVVEECNLYTTTEESGQNNLKLTVDDISAFVVLGGLGKCVKWQNTKRWGNL